MPKAVNPSTAGGRTTRREINAKDHPSDGDGWTYPQAQSGMGKSYKKNMLNFMQWFHQREKPYDNGTTFTRDELKEIQPVNVHDWLAIYCYGKADYNADTDKPTGARARTLLFKKKSVSFFMPNQMPQWCDDRGNPTKSIPVNKLIELVKKCEARKDRAKSHVKRPLTSHEFLAMQSKLKDHPDWSLNTKYQTMNLYQYHLTGQADDTCHFEVTDLCGNRSFDFALQTKVHWSKNIREERGSPYQIILGADDPNWCVFIHMSAYPKSFLEQHLSATYIFTESQDEKTATNNVKSAWSDKLRKFIWSTPEFKAVSPELEEDGGVGTHINRKHAATAASKFGCTSEQVEIRGRWKVAGRKQVHVYIYVN